MQVVLFVELVACSWENIEAIVKTLLIISCGTHIPLFASLLGRVHLQIAHLKEKSTFFCWGKPPLNTAFSQKVLIFQINGLWICDMYNIIDNRSKIFETCDNPFKVLNNQVKLQNSDPAALQYFMQRMQNLYQPRTHLYLNGLT